jgi:ABC-type transporter Mla subunit MlaD
VPVVAVTAFAHERDRERIRGSGCDACVTKPFDVSGLIEVIAQKIGNRAAESTNGGRADADDLPADAAPEPGAEGAEDEAADWRIADGFLASAAPPPEAAAATAPSEHGSPDATATVPPADGSPAAATDDAHPLLGGVALLFAFAFLGSALWPAWPRTGRDREVFHAEFPAAAFDLTVGSAVRYAGEEIGRVVRIAASPGAPPALHAVMELRRGMATAEPMVAHLRRENIVGKIHLDLRPATYAGAALKPLGDRSLGPILSVRSEMGRALADLPRFVARLAPLLDAGSELADRPDARVLSRSVAALGALAASLARTDKRLDVLLSDAEFALRALRGAAERIDAQADEAIALAETRSELRSAAGALARAAEALTGTIEEQRAPLRALGGQWREDISRLLSELRDLAGFLRQTAEAASEPAQAAAS